MWTSDIGGVEHSPNGPGRGFKHLACKLSEAGGVLPLEGLEKSPGDAARLLCNWGAARIVRGSLQLVAPMTFGLLTLFAPLLDLCRPGIFDTPLPGCPLQLKAGLADVLGPSWGACEPDILKLVAGGQGVLGAQALISCLGEMAERLSLFSQGTDDGRVFDRGDGGEELALGGLLGFSQRQERELARALAGAAAHFSGDQIDWNAFDRRRVCMRDLATGREVQVPAFGVLMGEGRGLGLSGLSLTSTAGAAVWSEPEEAHRWALHELVERDAVGQFWYNRLGITRLESGVWREFIHRNCGAYLAERQRKTIFLRVDTDLSAHVILAVSFERDGLGACLGASAAPTAEGATMSALGEMLQAEQSLGLMARAHKDAPPGAQPPSALRYASGTRIAQDLGIAEAKPADIASLSIVYERDALLESCLAKSVTLFAFDATRSDLAIPCIKIMSPHLCSWQPRFGKPRLFDGVVDRGWAKSRAAEQVFENRPFPF
ncbi:YcaO-like family protein [Roseibium sp.]|uniref:YcaO-like family protein n=1 Tax=Roseibium sp. TaxID=1936156 RepID=UPI00326666E1